MSDCIIEDCEREVTISVLMEDGTTIFLCEQCHTAYSLGREGTL